MPNSFTNQSAFQYSYKPFDWSRSRLVRDLTPFPLMDSSAVPALYRDRSTLDGASTDHRIPIHR